MSHPGAIITHTGFTLLVGRDLFNGFFVDFYILARNEGRHAADGVCATTVASLYKKLRVRIHERNVHRYTGAVGKHKITIHLHLLDDAEDVVPASCVQSRH